MEALGGRTAARIGLPVLALLLLAGRPSAQGGYTAEAHPELGMAFARARDYEAVPVRPSEEWVVLYYAEKQAFREQNRKRFRPELRVVWIDHRRPETGDAGEAEEEGRIDGFGPYMEAKWSRWEMGSGQTLDERSGNRVAEYGLEMKKGGQLTGWARTFIDDLRTVAVIGICADEDRDEQVRIWRTMFGKVKFHEPEDADLEKVRRYYDRSRYSHPGYRIRVRSRLVKGWKADDTENFIVVYSTKDEPLLRLIKSELEAIRKEYVKLFPPVREVEAISTVRVCKDRDEYLKYGGSPGSAGFWSVDNEELVFYDNENVGGKAGTGKANTRIVLYHEAFHQYVHYAVGELAPHSWFNEGTGDYFSGAVIRSGKVRKIGVNPWRIGLVKAALEGHPGLAPVRFSEILAMEQSAFYAPNIRSMCYAQAWSMIFFLRTSRTVARHPTWSTILDVYFDTLKDDFARRLELQSVTDPDPSEKTVAAIKQAAREAAVEKAFADVDLYELQREWKDFVLDL